MCKAYPLYSHCSSALVVFNMNELEAVFATVKNKVHRGSACGLRYPVFHVGPVPCAILGL